MESEPYLIHVGLPGVNTVILLAGRRVRPIPLERVDLKKPKSIRREIYIWRRAYKVKSLSSCVPTSE